MRKTSNIKITLLGDGAWGTTIAVLLINNGYQVNLWGPFPEYIREIRETRENAKFLPGVFLPAELKFYEQLSDAVRNSEILVLASPSQYMRSALEKLAPFYMPQKHILVNLAKGIEVGTLKRISEICCEVLGKCRYAVLSGPSHAEEVAKKCPTAVVAASENIKLAEFVQKIFMNGYFRVYTSDDITGVELGGALKNIFAIAAGIIDGMKLGDNSKAALITRGIAEMSRLGTALGGRYETFSGLSGVGDLIVTCTSRHSRNRHVGEKLGKGKKLDKIIENMGMVVAEGVKTTQSAYNLASHHSIDTPIINEVYEVLYNGKNPQQGLKDLMTRKAKHEMG